MCWTGGGDFALMVDPNDEMGSAYIAYDAWKNNHAVVIEKLTADYHDSLGASASTGQISPTNISIRVFFDKNGNVDCPSVPSILLQ